MRFSVYIFPSTYTVYSYPEPHDKILRDFQLLDPLPLLAEPPYLLFTDAQEPSGTN